MAKFPHTIVPPLLNGSLLKGSAGMRIRGVCFGFAIAFATAGHAAGCDVSLKNAHVWNGASFEVKTLWVRDGKFGSEDPTLPDADASALFLVPPFADAHTHTLEYTTGPDDARHKRAIREGIFYALNPNNIRPVGPTPAAIAGAVEVQAAGGGVTRPGGHPQPLYSYLATRGFLGPLTVADLPGKAFHAVVTPSETRNAVRAVKTNGAVVIKLYLLNHDKGARSDGLSAENFNIAVAEAKALGLRPIVHIESAADFRLAVKAGVYAIVHSPYAAPKGSLTTANYMLTAADAALAAKAGIVVVPTVTVSLMNYDGAQLAAVQAIQRHNLVLLRDAKVKMALGADNYSLSMHDEINTIRGFGLFGSAEVINMATTNGATLAFPGRKIGQLSAAYEASFIGYFFPLAGNWASQREPVVGMRAGEPMIDTIGLFAKACAAPQSRVISSPASR
jgi:imidazolonepropionase-like amidohydrolase